MKNYLKIGCLTALLAGTFGAVKACQKINQQIWSEPDIKEPAKEDFRNYVGVMLYPSLTRPSDDIGFGSIEGYIIDEDCDGTADLIQNSANVYCIADGYKSKRFRINPKTITMTTEIRNLATEVLKADQRLSYLLAKRAYEHYQQEKQKKGDSK